MSDQSSLFGPGEATPARKRPTSSSTMPSGNDSISGADKGEPLAARMRPRTLDEIVGQAHLVEPGRLLRRSIESDLIPSMILWGPPGSGKTTLADVIARRTNARFV